MKRQHSLLIAFALLGVIAASGRAQTNGSRPGPPADIMKTVRAHQDKMFKDEYGFSDKQLAEYHKKDDAIKAACMKKTDALRKKAGQSNATEKRVIFKQVFALEDQMEKDRQASLLAIATPAQQAKIKAKLARP